MAEVAKCVQYCKEAPRLSGDFAAAAAAAGPVGATAAAATLPSGSRGKPRVVGDVPCSRYGRTILAVLLVGCLPWGPSAVLAGPPGADDPGRAARAAPQR